MIDYILNQVSPKSLILGIIFIFVARIIINRIIENKAINALGGRAPTVKYYIPGGIDLIFRILHSTIHHKNLEGWQYLFKWGRPERPYTTEASIGPLRCIFTADPDNIKAILATQFGDYGKGKPFNDDWFDFLGNSIFTTDGDLWHNSRQLIRPQFIKDRVSDLEVFEKHVQILMDAIANGGIAGTVDNSQLKPPGHGREIDVCDLFFRYTLDAATDFLLGRSVESLLLPRQDFAEAFAEVQRVQNLIVRSGPFKYILPRASFKKGMEVINEFVNPFIEEALRLSPEELATKSKNESGYTFLHALAGFTKDRTILRDQLIAVLLAGRDTTAATLSWTFYELSRHPEVVQRLRQEIIDMVGLQNMPTYENLKNMKYLQNTMNEILRLYPVVPFNMRLALKDTTLPRGGGPDGSQPIGILKNTSIGYSTLLMQRRSDMYPPTSATFKDPMIFSPERWYSWQPKPWTYIPFNGGPRICIGQQFALTEMGYTIVRLLQRFEKVENLMHKIDGGHPCMKAEIVLQPGDGVKVGFWESPNEKV